MMFIFLMGTSLSEPLHSTCDRGILNSDLRPSGSVNRLGGPKKEILATSGEGWVEQSPLGVCPLLQNFPHSNSFYALVI